MASILMEQLAETVRFIQSQYGQQPQVGIILGSGLGNFTSEINVEKEIDYTCIPYFPASTVPGHYGKMIFGTIAGKNVVVLSGRFHFYEGYTPQQVTYPIRVLKLLGAQTLLLSNAAGAVNKTFKVGDLMMITDHISFFTPNPLLGKNEDEFGTRFPDMSEPYNRNILAKAKAIAKQLNYEVKEGVYVGVTGPTFETHAEYRLIAAVGGDAVGMSTVQETIVARHAGMDVFAVSVITDLGIRDDNNIITHEEVLAAAKEAEPKLTAYFQKLNRRIITKTKMKRFPPYCGLFLLLFLFCAKSRSQTAAKFIADCSITYSVSLEGVENNLTTKTLFIKGRRIRTDINYSSFHQSTILDNKTGDAVVLKTIGTDKYISSFTAQQWKEKNDKWDSVKVSVYK